MAKSPSNNPRPRPTGGGGSGSGSGKSGGNGRQSVAAARQSSGSNNRTQLIIGGVAVVLMIAVVVIGLVVNKQKNAVPADGYGTSTASTATVSDGVIVISQGTPAKTIDVYEDALCPICGEFEQQFGQQIAQSTDEGKVTVRLHMLNFLDPQSASKDYSTRAAGALLAVATEAGDQPGLVLKYHSALFSPDNQPAEGASSDRTNDVLAALAVSVGAPESVKASIAAGTYVAAAGTSATTSMDGLRATVGSVKTPTVLQNNAVVAINDVDWLTKIVG